MGRGLDVTTGITLILDDIFTQKTGFETLNQALKRLHHNKTDLLLVLQGCATASQGSQKGVDMQMIIVIICIYERYSDMWGR